MSRTNERVHQYASIWTPQLNKDLSEWEVLLNKSIFLDISAQLDATSVSEKQRILKYTSLWQKHLEWILTIIRTQMKRKEAHERSRWQKNALKIWSKGEHYMAYDFGCLCMLKWQNYLSQIGTVIWGAQSHVTLNKVRGWWYTCIPPSLTSLLMTANRCGTLFNAMLHKAGNRCFGLRASFLNWISVTKAMATNQTKLLRHARISKCT